MPCTPFRNGDGSVTGIVCTKSRRVRCRVPGCSKWSTKLCDWKLHKVEAGKRAFTGKTCDMPLCADHAKSPAPDKDLCPAHWKLACEAGFVAGVQ